jgi:hypothetical protein
MKKGSELEKGSKEEQVMQSKFWSLGARAFGEDDEEEEEDEDG